MGFTWHGKKPSDFLPQGADAVDEAVAAAVQKMARFYAAKIESWMKENAPWDDHTGNARQALHADVEDIVNGAVLYLITGMEYGVFLELANAGRWAVIGPALDHWTPIIWSDIQRLVSDL